MTSLSFTRKSAATFVLRNRAEAKCFSSGDLVVGTFLFLFSLGPNRRTLQSPCDRTVTGRLAVENRIALGYFYTCFILGEKERSDQDLGFTLDPDEMYITK